MMRSFNNFKSAITDPRFMVGRKELIAEIQSSPHLIRILLGGRRIGKTTTLRAAEWALLNRGFDGHYRAFPVFASFQIVQPDSFGNFLHVLIGELRKAMFRWRRTFKAKSHHPYQRFLSQAADEMITKDFLGDALGDRCIKKELRSEHFRTALLRSLEDLKEMGFDGICFLLDEAEFVVRQEWSDTAWGYIRALKDSDMSLTPFLGFVLSGYRALKEYRQRVGSPLVGIAELEWLSVLPDSDLRELIAKRCLEENTDLNDKQLRFVICWSGRHPYLVMQLLNCFFDDYQKGERSTMARIAEKLLHRYSEEFSSWWDPSDRPDGLGRDERCVYLELINVRKARVEELAFRTSLSHGRVLDALEVLETSGLIYHEKERYVVGAKAFETWVRMNATPAVSRFGPASTSENPIRILHLSDLHFDASTDISANLGPLVMDLTDTQGGLGLRGLDFLVISGDASQYARPQEFDQAREFIKCLRDTFSLNAERCILIPGNHDVSWDEKVYEWKPKRLVARGQLYPGHYREEGCGYLLREDRRYGNRFKNFSEYFFRKMSGSPYPMRSEEQSITYLDADLGIQILAFNSCWEIDEWFPLRASIHPGVVSRALLKADGQIEAQLDRADKVLRIAVWHHPVTGNDKIKDDAFLDQLRRANVRLVLHGHVHENRAEVIGYFHPKKLYVIGAGAFGAPTHRRPESTPRLYNVLEIERDHSLVKVHTRCLRRNGGAWEGWAVWAAEDPTSRRTYYTINLHE
ncbi:MAG: metallophosphoesterase [bacterium]|nr:metallophosphoesterase [bacterium]